LNFDYTERVEKNNKQFTYVCIKHATFVIQRINIEFATINLFLSLYCFGEMCMVCKQWYIYINVSSIYKR